MKTLGLLFTLASFTFAAPNPTVVLVHGAFADGSSWARVIPILERDGYTVIAVQNPLTSLADDVATTKRVIDAQRGPVLVVGHSYGGAVITAAAAGNPNVKALVYIAAFPPEANEVLAAPSANFTAPALNSALVPDAAGFCTSTAQSFVTFFAETSRRRKRTLAAVTQKPVNSSVFAASVTAAAWKTTPSWYIVASEDRAINPELERFYAKRIGATTTEIKSSHVPFCPTRKTWSQLSRRPQQRQGFERQFNEECSVEGIAARRRRLVSLGLRLRHAGPRHICARTDSEVSSRY